jgi:MerR family transcriptional regulator, light-induced transcriptional regulator
MNQKTFMEAFDRLDKETCVTLAYEALSSGAMDVATLYDGVLRKSMENLTDVETDPTHKIWKEHIKSSIIRTIIEMSFPFVVKAKATVAKGRAAVVCPDGEEHELGARMISDYLTLLGYETYFVGKSTPKKEFVDLIESLNLDVVALSVTNYYNFSVTLKTVELIREHFPNLSLIAGGRGFDHNPQALAAYNVTLAQNFADLARVTGASA